ncbi:MAG TPA: DUF262 domain-containing protein [Planctomycetaceae bacterium]|nr:DUF262 domain-containing protein [Planctomycetaceae bacterium]
MIQTREDRAFDVIPDELDDFYSDDDLYNINSWGADLSFRELITQYKDGDLLKPEMQRNYVWDKTEASRFIDSLLLGLPVPSIFLAKTAASRMLIVDGYQRIMTVNDYVRGIFSTDEKVFKLTRSSKINPRWRGKAFAELSESEQRKIRSTTIHCIIFQQIKPRNNDTSLYQIFERINSSGRTLLPQEIRNCVYQGDFNKLLLRLNLNSSWRTLYGLEKPDSRMRDIEFVLRFFALASGKLQEAVSESISLKKFLNDCMGAEDANDIASLERREAVFVRVTRFLLEHMGEQAFQNISPKQPEKSSGRFNPTIFDSIMIATARALDQDITPIASQLRERRLRLLQDPEYQDLIRIRTTKVERINRRNQIAHDYLYGAQP